MQFGDVVFVNFPFADLSSAKRRPAIVLAEVKFGPDHDIVVVMITKNRDRMSPFDILLESSHDEFAAAGLNYTSVIRVHRLVTLTANMVDSVKGRLGQSHREELTKALARLLPVQALASQDEDQAP